VASPTRRTERCWVTAAVCRLRPGRHRSRGCPAVAAVAVLMLLLLLLSLSERRNNLSPRPEAGNHHRRRLQEWLPRYRQYVAQEHEQEHEQENRRQQQQDETNDENEITGLLANKDRRAGTGDVISPTSKSNFQPKITRVEHGAATKAIGSVSMARSSPWCPNGGPMVWLVGHQPYEQPWCYDSKRGEWTNTTSKARLATNTRELRIDRHDCVTLDANADGVDDLVCLVGANKGRGLGLQELCE